jgi:hypothetical protein
MSDSEQSGPRRRYWLRWILAVIAILLIALFMPPLVGVNHYKIQITQLIAQSLGRPVRVSSVQVRLLPWPGFVLYDLSVAEDPAYGAEPVLHASKVTASIRLFSLLRGRMQIGSISVDEASLNIVRAGPGRWNLDPLFRTAAQEAGSIGDSIAGSVAGASPNSGEAMQFPSLQATDSRIDFKDGAEKLPFSLVAADLSVWQSSPGEWRIRLRGQPARTDVSLYLEDTGLVRMEATMRRAAQLSQMPLHVDLDWRQAQLGQLARLATGSDPGWRGDLTGELHLDGTADAATIAMRLRASGVHRAEFAPSAPLDFDANCNFIYHYSQRSLRNLACDSPLGDGRIHLTGDKPRGDAPPDFAVALDRVSVSAGLDALRTLRSGIQPDLNATGTVSGKLTYAPENTASVANGSSVAPARRVKPGRRARHGSVRVAPVVRGPLTGSLIVENLALTGGGLTRPLQSPKITLTAGAQPHATGSSTNAELAGSAAIAAGGAIPLTLGLRFSLSGYQVAAHGQAAIPRAREIANAAGIPASAALQSLAGDPIGVDLVAAGPWLAPEQIVLPNQPAPIPSPMPLAPIAVPTAAPATGTNASRLPSSLGDAAGEIPATDTLAGTVTLRNVNWKADFLANHLTISQATLHFENGGLRWDPVAFSYGLIDGTASLILPPRCPAALSALACPAQLPPTFHVEFGDLNAASFQTALLGAREPGTLLSTLLDRIHPASAPPWPSIEGTVTAGSLVLGPVTLTKISAAVAILPAGAEVSAITGELLGGRMRASGTLHKPATDEDKPAYSFSGDFADLDAHDVGELLGVRWTGSAIAGNGKVDLAGYTNADLTASAKGTLHFKARRGAIEIQADPANGLNKPPAALNHFDRWTADAAIADGEVQLGANQVASAGRAQSVDATVTFGDPLTLNFEPVKPSVAKR